MVQFIFFSPGTLQIPQDLQTSARKSSKLELLKDLENRKCGFNLHKESAHDNQK